MGGWSITSPGRPIPGTGQNITIGATSTQNATAFGAQTQVILVTANGGNCHIELGTNPTATASSLLVKSTDYPKLLRIAPGEKIAVIQDGSSTGTLNVCEFTW